MGEGSPIPILIVFGGLPATGKTTLARALARHLGATYLRIDQIEQVLRSKRPPEYDLEDEGYVVAYRLAAENLRLGTIVVADSVNPIQLTRDAWFAVATDAGVKAVKIEIVCSDGSEHRRRVETRTTDIPGLQLPDWKAVETREYDPWNRDRIVIDTAARTVEESLAALLSALRDAGAA